MGVILHTMSDHRMLGSLMIGCLRTTSMAIQVRPRSRGRAAKRRCAFLSICFGWIAATAPIFEMAHADTMRYALISVVEGAYCGEPLQAPDKAPKTTKTTYIPFPERALQRRLGGFSIVRFQIDPAGRVEKSEILWASSSAGFGSNVQRVVETFWEFEPNRSGAFCVVAQFRLGQGFDEAVLPEQDPTIPDAPEVIAAPPPPASDLKPVERQCSTAVDVFLGDNGIPVATTTIGPEPKDTACRALAEQMVWHWRFARDATPGRYRLGVMVSRTN